MEADVNTARVVYFVKKFGRMIDITFTLCPETGDITAEIL
jgi:hypothetical protein